MAADRGSLMSLMKLVFQADNGGSQGRGVQVLEGPVRSRLLILPGRGRLFR
jgi:hypothetical protein